MSEIMIKFGIWLAHSPLGGMFKAASGAVLVWVLDNVASLDLSPVLQVAVVAALPVLINYINGMDPRYPHVSEQVNEEEE